MKVSILGNPLADSLKHVYDLERIISRISYGSIDAKDCLSLKRSIGTLPELHKLLGETKSVLLSRLYSGPDSLAADL